MKLIATIVLYLCISFAACAQLSIGGRPALHDRLTNTYLVVVPENYFNHNVQLEVKKPDNCRQLYINGINVSNNTFTFNNINANNIYFATFINNNGIPESKYIKFSFLPVIHLNGNFGYDYQQGSVNIYDPEKTTVDTLQANIKWRGGTTNVNGKHKRNYRIKLPDDKSIFGMRNDNNWILDAGQADVFRLRNRVAMDIWNDINTPLYYADMEPKARAGISGIVVEVFLNDEYMGIYNFSENMDRKQMKVKKVDAQTGNIRGCIYKAMGWSNTLMYDTLYTPYDNHKEAWTQFEVKYPDLADNDTTDWSTLYNAIDFVVMSSEDEFRKHVAEYFDIPAIIDYCIFGSALNALDNYGKNIIWAVYDKNVDKKLTVGAWDLDCTVGQRWAAVYNPNFTSPGFLYDMTFGLTRRLVGYDVDNFVDKLNSRYQELRQTVLSTESLQQKYRYYYDLIARSGAASRETTRWSGDSDIRGEQISFDYEINYIENWIKQHMQLIDTKGFPLSLEVIPVAIETPYITNTDNKTTICDLSGRRLSNTKLSRGIYIVNGRKMLVR